MNFKPVSGAAYQIKGTIKSLGAKASNINCICAGREDKKFKFITLRSRVNENEETEFSPLVFWLTPSEIDEVSIDQLIMAR